VIFAVIILTSGISVSRASVRLESRVVVHFHDPQVSNTPYYMEDMIMVFPDPSVTAR
jgi:hypothetical protein